MIKCPICKNTTLKNRRKVLNLNILSCVVCGLTFCDPLVEGNEEVGFADSSKTSDNYYLNIKKKFDQQCLKANKKAILLVNYWEKIIQKKINSILEIGCGSGVYYQAFNKLDINWFGIEVNEEIIQFANNNGIPVKNINIMEKDINDKFDVIFMSQVLEHIFNPSEFMRKIKKIMNPHSIIHLDVPNHNSLTATIRKYNFFQRDYGFIQPYHHQIAYIKESLIYLLSHCDLNIKEIFICSNDHKIFGQLLVDQSIPHMLIMRLSDIINRGSILGAIAQTSNNS